MPEATGLKRSVDGARVLTLSAALFGASSLPCILAAPVARAHQPQVKVILRFLCFRIATPLEQVEICHTPALWFVFVIVRYQINRNAYEKNEDRGYWRHWAHRSKAREEFTAARPRGRGGSSLFRR